MASTPACFNQLTRLMPIVRAETARRLVAEGLHQERVAEHLGVSQAMVSKYLRRPPERDSALPASLVRALVDGAVRRAVAEEQRGSVAPWCPVCETLCDEGVACALSPFADARECLRGAGGPSGRQEERVLQSLREAEDRIRGLPFGRLLPEVRSNVAMAVPNPHSTRDVTAFPGRLVEIDGEIRGAAPPTFGSSSHLAGVLLKVQRTRPGLCAILNARFDEAVRRALRAGGLRFHPLKRRGQELAVSLPKTGAVDAVIDPGAFGIEPALYLLGETALDVVRKAELLLEHLPNHRSQKQ